MKSLEQVEEWRVFQDSRYSISSLGRVINNRTGRILKQWLNDGYPTVNLYFENGRKQYPVHTLVGITFKGYDPESVTSGQTLIISHINNVRSDCRAVNLKIRTQRENTSRVTDKLKKSGLPRGVSFHKASGKFAAQIKINGIKTHLGLFTNIDDAANVYKLKLESLKGKNSHV